MTRAEVGAKPRPFHLPTRPYPGLRPFETTEWMIFFGRESMIEDVVERLAHQRLVFIHGASGCGKSSLVRAGVLPKLARQHLSHGAAWHTFAMRPSSSPLWNLAAEFARLEGRPDDSARIDEIVRLCDKRGATLRSIARAIEGLGDRPLCILVDQFEEIFRFEREVSREEAELFIDLLTGAAAPATESDDDRQGCRPRTSDHENDVDIRLVVTMRSEFLGNCTRFDGLAETINRTQYLVPRMSREGLSRAIRRPAQIYGGEVTIDLAERLIAEVRGHDDELPLIQHGLMLLWDEAAAHTTGKIRLDIDMLGKHNSLGHMLSDHADAVMAAVAEDATQKRAVETLFRSLTEQIGEKQAIRRPQPFRELAAVVNVEPQVLRALIDGFRADGVSFLMPPLPAEIDDTTIIDISHEALIRCWAKIADPRDGWLKRETADGIVWGVLRTEAREFATNPKLVLSGEKLNDRLRWIATKTEKWANRYGGDWAPVAALLDASQREAKKASRGQKMQIFGINAIMWIVLMCALIIYGHFEGGNTFIVQLQIEDQFQLFALIGLLIMFIINLVYGLFSLMRILLSR